MEFDPNQFAGMKKPSFLQLSSSISVFVGGALIIISLFLQWPVYIYFISIGAALVLYYFIVRLSMKFIESRKNHVKKSKKSKAVKIEHIKDDVTHVLATCPGCGQRIRLQNKKGTHGVNCPSCKNFFEVHI